MAKVTTKKAAERIKNIKSTDLIKENKKDSLRLKDQLNRIRKKQPLISEQEIVNYKEKEVETKISEEILKEPEFTEPTIESISTEPVISIPEPVSPTFESIPESKIPNSEIVDMPSPELGETLGKKISMFDDLVKETEQDGQQINKIESLADDFLDESFQGNELEDSLEVRKTNAKISAGVWVTVIDVGMMVGCLFLSNDFSDDSQRKFSLIPERKNSIKHSIYQILMLRKKKTNPVYSLVLAIVGSYAPMFVIAFLSGRKKRAAEKEGKQNKAAAQAMQAMAVDANPVPIQGAPVQSQQQFHYPMRPVNNADIVENYGGKIYPMKRAQSSKGRHKIGCNYYLGKECNCKHPDFKGKYDKNKHVARRY